MKNKKRQELNETFNLFGLLSDCGYINAYNEAVITDFLQFKVLQDITLYEGRLLEKGTYFMDVSTEIYMTDKTKVIYKGIMPLKFGDIIRGICDYMNPPKELIELINRDIEKTHNNSIDYKIPTSPALQMIDRTFTTLSTGRIPNNNKNVLYKDEHKEIAEQGFLTLTQVKADGKSEISITLPDMFAQKQGKGLTKLFTFIMQKANEQNFNDTIGFSLHDLVDVGMYKTLRIARQGVEQNIPLMTKLSLDAKTETKKQKELKGFVPIHEYSIKNNYVTLKINEKTKTIAPYYTLLPNYAYRLNNNSFKLLKYIFYLARQNTEEIRRTGHFNIGLRTIADFLQLPVDTRRAKQLVKDPIINAIEEIEAFTTSDFTITPLHKKYASGYDWFDIPLNDWLDGYIEVCFDGTYANFFGKIADKHAKKIEDYKKKPSSTSKTEK